MAQNSNYFKYPGRRGTGHRRGGEEGRDTTRSRGLGQDWNDGAISALFYVLLSEDIAGHVRDSEKCSEISEEALTFNGTGQERAWQFRTPCFIFWLCRMLIILAIRQCSLGTRL
jgi:hypothetical protein